jgi:twitching motility protein PilU
MSQIRGFLKIMVQRMASDLFLSPGSPVHLKVDGTIAPLSREPLSAEQVDALAQELMDSEQCSAFAERPEMNLGLNFGDQGRFRVNIFRQRGQTAIVVRYLQSRIPGFTELGLPPILAQLVLQPRGLMLVVGATGAGKSTTLAAMIDHRNAETCSHILTIEDPIEYLHGYKRSIVNQREVGLDTHSFDDALKNALREAPDVILIGEIRDRATMQHAIAYAETGHLCLASLHASNANQALQRVISFFPEDMYDQLFLELSQHLAAIVSQRLVRDTNGRRIPAVEVMRITPLIRDLIRKGAVHEVREAMEKHSEDGMQTFDQSLYELYRHGRISKEEALANAESSSNLGVRIRLDAGVGS